MPNSPFRVGQVYLLTSKWRFEVRQRSGAGCVWEEVFEVWLYIRVGGDWGAGGTAKACHAWFWAAVLYSDVKGQVEESWPLTCS